MHKEERRVKKCMARVLSPKEARARAYKRIKSFMSRWEALQVDFSNLYNSKHHKQGDK